MQHSREDDIYKAGLPTICSRYPPIVCLQVPLFAIVVPQDAKSVVEVAEQ